MKEKLKNIKEDKIKSVFEASLSKRTVTRNELSDITGLSFVTVNNIASALVDAEILRQSKGTDKNGSRRSRILSVKLKYWIGIYNICATGYSFNILDLALKTVHSFEYVPSKDKSLQASIKDFLKDASLFASQHVDTSFCCGIGILVPGEYDELSDTVATKEIPHFSALRISQQFTPFSFGHKPLIISSYRAFSYYQRSKNDGYTYSLFLNKNSILSALIPPDNSGDVFLSDLGSIPISDTKCVSDCIAVMPDADVFFKSLAAIVYTVLHTAPVSKITLSGNLFSRIEAVGEVFRRRLLMICEKSWYIPPKVIAADHIPDAVTFLGKSIRTTWFSSYIAL